MPHSSGGGSHSGGSHSGGGSHSSSSSGGSGSSGPNRSYSRTYFNGARHYVYYKNKKPIQYYSEENITLEFVAQKKRVWKTTKIVFLCIYIALYLFLVLGGDGIHFPHKIKIKSDRTASVIVDNTDVISGKDEDELMITLEEFYNKTGIPVMVYTTTDDEWNDDFTSLENFAYDKYITTFHSDESCWLIVYSEPDAKPNGFVDWKWEGMQGDNTDPVLTVTLTDKFTKTVQKQITNYGIGKALNIGFKNLNNNVTKITVNPVMLIGYSIGTAYIVGWFFIFAWLICGRPIKRYESSIKLEYPNLYKEDTCTYCGGMYIHGIHISCPHCGGALQPLDEKVYIADPNQLRS